MAISFVDISLSDDNVQTEHETLHAHLAKGYTIIGHSTYANVYRYGENNEFVDETTYWERYTLYKPDGSGESIKTDELVLDNITSIERGETSNSNSPIWRCTTANGERVNIFKHEDENIDNFHLFEKKGWGQYLLNMAMYIGEDTYPVAIAMKKDGKWWSIVNVMQAPTTLPGDETLDDVFPLTSADDDESPPDMPVDEWDADYEYSDDDLDYDADDEWDDDDDEYDNSDTVEPMSNIEIADSQLHYPKVSNVLLDKDIPLPKVADDYQSPWDESEGAEHGE